MLETYDKRSKPVWDHSKPINVTFSMDLYQILEVNEPQQYVLLNAWVIERWYDEFLYWRPADYDNITEIHLPHNSIWLPDTTLYNSLVMKDDDTRRLLNVKLTADEKTRTAYIELLYPTIYKFSCLLNLRFFPFDIQESILYRRYRSVCSMIFSSWTFDQTGIDYFAHSDTVGTTNYIENEGWHILRTSEGQRVHSHIYPFPESLCGIGKGQAKLISINRSFSVKKKEMKTSTASGMREEKVSLGITTLLSMSILMLMISDQMPTTSTFIPLIGWFILAMITIITFGTLASSVIIAIQKRGRQKSRLTPRTVCFVKFIACITLEDIPKHLMETHEELKTTASQKKSEKKHGLLKTRELDGKRQELMKAKEPQRRWKKQRTFLQKRQKTQLIEPHLCELPTLANNNSNGNNNADLLSPKHAQCDFAEISDTPDTVPAAAVIIPVSSPVSQHDVSEGGSTAPKVNGSDSDSVFTSLEKPNIDSVRQKRPSQNVSNLCDEAIIRQNRRLARDEYDWMAKVLERLFFILFIIIFVLRHVAASVCCNLCIFSDFLRNSSIFFRHLSNSKISKKIIVHWTSIAASLLLSYLTILRQKVNIVCRLFAEMGTNDEMHYFISARQQLPHIRLVRDLLSTERYDPNVRPVLNHSEPLTVHVSMSLYQLIDVDEPSQCLTLNIWMIQALYFAFCLLEISKIFDFSIKYFACKLNVELSMVMSREGSERYLNAVVKSRYWDGKFGAEVSFLYPALYTVRCRINIRYFPYDHQNCILTLGSWTSSKTLLNYTSQKTVNMQSYIPNEEWDILSFSLHRREYRYACCQDPWIIIEGSLVIRRKPLYYIVNLIIPTTVLTLVGIVGFFTPASTSDERTEKITIGITALLAISILMLMVSDQMPTTSDFVPLIAWFYLSNIIVISTATFCTCTVLCIHGNHRNGKLPPSFVRILFFKYICNYLCVSPPHELMMLWSGSKGKIAERLKQRKKSIPNIAESTDRKKSVLTELSVKPSLQRTAKDDIGEKTERKAPRFSARENWARLSLSVKDISSKNEDHSEVMRKESSLMSFMQKMRKIPTAHSDRKHVSLWNTAVQFIRFTSDDLPRKVESAELKSLKYHRQCTLEWEFLATVVDRVFLLFFSTITILIVTALAVIAKLAQYHFDSALEIDQN
uniref:Neur_chan_LBD domain-containing protein n=1 Tax=Elaeophora elaphi TaxID=1147741 RepID=A0A0R3RV86_9BILA